MSKATTRHLKYAWVEYGNPLDGQAFTDGLFRIGWRNVVGGFPVKKDKWGVRHVDASHPLLPIRWRGSALLILPNERLDVKEIIHPFIKDPIFEDFRKANGDDVFSDRIREQNAFIAEWVFAPGVKKVSNTESHLTTASDFTDYADLVSISGHGAGGGVWGGGAHAYLQKALQTVPEAHSDRLKYMLIPACTNVSEYNTDGWMPVFRRKRHPLHGLFGYRDSYPGDQPGRDIYARFARNLHANGGKKTILDAYREAHVGGQKKIWSAMLHVSAKQDIMKDWLAGKLAKPDPDGPVHHFSESSWPGGTLVVVPDPEFKVHFMMDATRITESNKNDLTVGLFPGEKGALELTSKATGFEVGDRVTIVFYYYRAEHDEMDLNKLLTFGTPSDGTVKVLTDINKLDNDKNADAIEFTFSKKVASRTLIPYTVAAVATKHFHSDGDHHGYFNMKLTPPGETEGFFTDVRFYQHGAFLRPKKP